MPRRRLGIFALIATALAGTTCSSSSTPSSPIVLSSDTMTVTIGAPRFSLEVKNAKGEVVLSTIDDTGLYRPLTTLHRSVDMESHLIEGWDYQVATDGEP